MEERTTATCYVSIEFLFEQILFGFGTVDVMENLAPVSDFAGLAFAPWPAFLPK